MIVSVEKSKGTLYFTYEKSLSIAFVFFNAGKYVTKGARIGITGRLNVDTWTDKVTGEERWSKKIVVRHLDILESRAEAELRMGNRGRYGGNRQGAGGYGGNNNDDYDDGPSSAGSGGFFDN